MIRKSYGVIEERLFANIIYTLLGESSMYQYLNEHDDTVIAAAELVREGKTYPQAPEEEDSPGRKEKKGALQPDARAASGSGR